MQGEVEDQLVEAAKRHALAERHKTESVRLANAAQEEREHAQLLKKQGTDEAMQQAYEVYMRGYETVGEYRFRANAGDIRIEQVRSQLKALKDRLKRCADELGLPSPLLAQSRTLEALVATAATGNEELPEELRGWREAVVGRRLMAALRDMAEEAS